MPQQHLTPVFFGILRQGPTEMLQVPSVKLARFLREFNNYVVLLASHDRQTDPETENFKLFFISQIALVFGKLQGQHPGRS